jgi:hypothetical protein
MALYPEQLKAAAVIVIFAGAYCNNTGQELAQAFCCLTQFGWFQPSWSLPNVFLPQFCQAVGTRLTTLHLTGCGLRELPRQMAFLVNLRTLLVDDNDIVWIDYRLASALTQLDTLSVSGNKHLMAVFETMDVRAGMRHLCALDAANRASVACFMAVLRKRLRIGRDLVQLLGKALWTLRFTENRSQKRMK